MTLIILQNITSQFTIVNCESTIPHTIRLCEGVLNRVPVTQFCVDDLNTIQEKQQSMAKKFQIVSVRIRRSVKPLIRRR